MTPWRLAAAVAAVGLVVLYAFGSGRWVATGSSWYQSLEQPSWQPPGAVFGLAWTYNFLALGVVGVAM
jgi:tryptophan-rich sensory protein